MSSPSPVNNIGSTLIRAGAGAGKTTRLIEEVYLYFNSFKKENLTWPRVVLTTFSNKATQEINERLLKKAIETHDMDFFEFINSKSHLLVSTIHGVLHVFISQNQSEFGLTKDFQVVSDFDIASRHQKLFRRVVMDSAEAKELLETFSLSELFGLVKDYQHFTRSLGELAPFSADQFKEYIQDLQRDVLMGFRNSVSTLRGGKLTPAWDAVVQIFPSLEGDPGDVIVRLVEWNSQIRKPTVTKKGEPEVMGAQTTFLNALEKLRELYERNYHELSFEKFRFLQAQFKALADAFCVAAERDQHLSQEIAISDIETLSFHAQQEKSYLFEEFSKKWDFWMIDEFQDTSPIQISLLERLIGASRAFFVGDPQQSIYYFRGSDSRVFDSKYSELERKGKVEVLSKNYRSHGGVLNFINEFFSRQYSQFQKMDVTKSSLDLQSDVTIFEIEDKSLSSELIALQIGTFVEKNPSVPLEDIVVLSRTNRDLNDLAAELEKIEIPHYVHTQGQFFKQREIIDILFFVRFIIDPQNSRNLSFLLKTPPVGLENDDIKSILKGFKNWESLIEDRERFSSKVAGRVFDLNTYLMKSQQIGLLETVQLYVVNECAFVLGYGVDSSGKKESNIWKLFFWLKEQLSRGMDTFLIQLDAVLTADKNDEYEEAETQAIVEPKKIQMMTIHASKGLQFPHVIMIGLDKSPRTRGRHSLDVDTVKKEFSIFIKNKAKDDKIKSPIHWQQAAIQSERESEEFERLLYVALTRAKKQLSLFTLTKFSDSSWASRFKDFYLHYLGNKESLAFKMNWIPIQAEDKEVVETRKSRSTASEKKSDGAASGSLATFLLKLEERKGATEARGPISFSSSKASRDVNLHQILVSQRGIGIHQFREKGVFDFSYYPDIGYSASLSQIFGSGFKEYRFTFLYRTHQFVGSIDFVYFDKDRILIVDYKSGRSVHTDLYKQQLIFYAECLSFIKKLDHAVRFDLIIDYVDQKKIERTLYQSIGSSVYFEKFLQDKKSENIVR